MNEFLFHSRRNVFHAMIMAGGGGTRFWPRSRNSRPKQFLTFSGSRTLLQGTTDRISAIIPPERTWVVTGAAYTQESASQLPEIPFGQIVGEPCRRDTAPCVGLGAALIARHDSDATIIVMPADHVIEPEREFHRAVHAAAQFVEEFPDALLTFGIPPAFPSQGYGYIQRGAKVSERSGISLSNVQAFKEKPNEAKAREFVDSGEFFWNSGIFVWKARTILEQLRLQNPAIHTAVLKIAAAWGSAEQEAVFQQEYQAITGLSIDYAVMENAPKRMVVQAPYVWDDVGSWLALERHNPQDPQGNTVQGQSLLLDTKGCIISSEGQHLIATIGVEDLLIIHVGDATLVARKSDEARVRDIVKQLEQQQKEFL